MSSGIEDYYKNIREPWFKMMYDVAYRQLNISHTVASPLKILDFGSGFGVTASYYAQWHEVTAVEPNPDMRSKRFCGGYTQIDGGLERLAEYADGSFDVIICHNVLEYATNKEKEEIFKELARVLKASGVLSLIKHNKYGKIMHSAVFEADPQKSFDMFDGDGTDISHSFGDRQLYSRSDVEAWTEKYNLKIENIFGIRTFFCLIQDNSVKYDPDWYQKMTELELRAGEIEEYKNIAFLNHFIMKKL